MHIIFLTKGDRTVPSSRQRVYQVCDYLTENNPDITHEVWHCAQFSQLSFWGRIKLAWQFFGYLWRHAKTAVFYLHRPIYNKYLLAPLLIVLVVRRPVAIFDYDDAIYTHSRVKTLILHKLCCAVVAANHALVAWSRQYNNNVHLIPTSVSLPDYEKAAEGSRKQTKLFVVGWVGSGRAYKDSLKIVADPLKQLAQEVDLEFRIIGGQADQELHDFWKKQAQGNFSLKIIDQLDWSQKGVVAEQISEFDVGIMPLTDTAFNRGKSAFKAIEYMACKVPVIASTVGENSYLIQDGHNGNLAATAEEWHTALCQLALDKEERHRLAVAGFATVREGYSFCANVPRLIDLIVTLSSDQQ